MTELQIDPIPPGVAVRVRPPHDHAGMAVVWCVIGAGVGAAAQIIMRAGVVPMLWVQLAVIVLFPGVVCIYLARCCQHVRAGFLIAATSTLGLGGGLFSAYLNCEPLQWAAMSRIDVLFAFSSIVLFATVVGGVALAVRAMWVSGRMVLRTQDGTLCPACAYIVGRPPDAGRCSECGLELPAETPGHGPVMRLANGLGPRRVVRGIVLLGVIVVALGVPARRGRDVIDFRAGIAGGRAGALIYGGSQPLDKWVEVTLPQSSTAARLVAEYHVPAEDLPFIRVVCWTPAGHQFAVRLTPPHTRRALADGLPRALVEHLMTLAGDAATGPGVPEDARRAAATTSECVVVDIDGAPFFDD